MPPFRPVLVFSILLVPAFGALTGTEQRIAAAVDAGLGTFAAELEAHVRISSPTEDHAGVRRLGAWFETEFAKLGFATRWSPIPEANRSGHVIAERRGTRGRRLLLIGHLDTVLPAGEFRIENGRAYGSGTNDMKGGNLVILHALRALHAAGALEDTSIAVILTGDEEDTGEPMSVSRRDLYELAARSDAALAFETAIGDTGTVARRGFASWTLEVQGATGHSSAIWGNAMGSGSIYETAASSPAGTRTCASSTASPATPRSSPAGPRPRPRVSKPRPAARPTSSRSARS